MVEFVAIIFFKNDDDDVVVVEPSEEFVLFKGVCSIVVFIVVRLWLWAVVVVVVEVILTRSSFDNCTVEDPKMTASVGK
jgi:type IV secretory pathway TrbD component